MCNVDAAITASEQYAVFPAGDASLQRRTARTAFTNATSVWQTNWEFKASTALMAALDALESGSMEIADQVWSSNDEGFNADQHDGFVSAQFVSGLRYFNKSGSGLLHIPPETKDAATNCGGGGGSSPLLGCDPLIDWPVQTRDGYVVSAEDSIRNGISAAAIAGLSQLAGFRGDAPAAARYAAVAASIRAAVLRDMVRVNGSEAFVVDGPRASSPTASAHAAIHSTLYAVAGAGIADVGLNETGDAGLACKLATYLIRRDTGGASCMTARWHVEALYRLGVQCSAAADAALNLLSRETYPSWRFMMSAAGGSATMTLESWQPSDKWNTDFSHPWCASPAFLIPRFLAGLRPLGRGWARFLAAPQPGALANFTARAPTPLGDVGAAFSQGVAAGVHLTLTVPGGAAAQVCLPPLHDASGGGAGDELFVDGQPVRTSKWGRMLCAAEDVGKGTHTVQRMAAAGQ